MAKIPIEKTLQLSQKYGLSVVLLVIGIFFFMRQYNMLLNKALEGHEPEKEIIQNTSERDTLINKELCRLLEVFKAQKVLLFQFHNGKTSLAGFPFIYASMTHQQVEYGYSITTSGMQNIPIGLISECVELFCKKYSVHRYNNEFWMMKLLGLKECHAVPIFSSDEVLIGFIVIGFSINQNYDEHLARKNLFPASLVIRGYLYK